MRQLAIKIPCPRVERTTEALNASTFRAQESSSVQTTIYIGTNFSGGGSYDNDGVVNNLINDVIADIGNLFFTTRQLPTLAPHGFYFAVVPFLGEVTFG